MKFYIFAKCFYLAMIIAWACGFILGSGLILNGLYALIFSAGHSTNGDLLAMGTALIIGAPIIISICHINYLNSCCELNIMADFENSH